MAYKQGFTLIELMVAVSIMGILATIAVPSLFGVVEKAKEKSDLAWVYYIRNAFDHQIAAQGGQHSLHEDSCGGILYDVMNELGWADIYKNVGKSEKYYKFPGKFFSSRALTRCHKEGGASSQNKYWINARWASDNPNQNPAPEGSSVIVWLGTGDWNDPLIGNMAHASRQSPKPASDYFAAFL